MARARPRSHHRHHEKHLLDRMGWLRAAVLGANDGIVSTASLIVGVAAAESHASSVMIAGVAGLVAGAMSMAAGEYVSVHSQQDLENAAIDEERAELKEDRQGEHDELAAIYVRRGLDAALAEQVATQLMERDALGAHARDELGITKATLARPLQAAAASALSFSLGGLLPLLVAVLAKGHTIAWVSAAALVSLGLLGGIAARAGNAPVIPGVARVVFWSAIAMAVTAGVGTMFGASA